MNHQPFFRVVFGRIPVVGFNESLHLIISCQPTRLLIHTLFLIFIRPQSSLRDKDISTELPNSFQVFLHFFGSSKIPSSSCGTNGPSLHSKKQLPVSNDSTLCHTPLGIFTPYFPSSGQRTTSSKIDPSSL